MSRLRRDIDARDLHIKSQWVIILIFGVIIYFMWSGWKSAPDEITLRYPPDIRVGATYNINEVPAHHIYSSAFYVWQQANQWMKNGERDHPENMEKMACFISQDLRVKLNKVYQEKLKNGEVSGRSRFISSITGRNYRPERVLSKGAGTWIVSIDVVLKEFLDQKMVKNVPIRYSLMIEESPYKSECNPYGLIISDLASEPRQLLDVEIEGEIK
ncbi:PFL_4703 family integrating conjugative element protein [Motilimonas cestriensis]|uniref:PFL_4703 family integrating conjugative element protein n=1 Tax=Motilimonas cestriensis TaxID=2742685 RepID=UPI003DA3D96B